MKFPWGSILLLRLKGNISVIFTENVPDYKCRHNQFRARLFNLIEDHLYISHLIIKLYAFINKIIRVISLTTSKMVPGLARAMPMGRTTNLKIMFSYFEDIYNNILVNQRISLWQIENSPLKFWTDYHMGNYKLHIW